MSYTISWVSEVRYLGIFIIRSIFRNISNALLIMPNAHFVVQLVVF